MNGYMDRGFDRLLMYSMIRLIDHVLDKLMNGYMDQEFDRLINDSADRF
jgi:hypothetical protein